ncbi:MAG: pantoate--beta-alanine ligase [Myxococcales bacterium]|nr:pantoate--beta-alanine ligase [Myxococcales bacterium]
MSPTEPRRLTGIRELQCWADAERAARRRIALVPTMGALHEGHLALVHAAGAWADRVVVSVFVNPTQFGPDEDFERYPRDLERDCELLGEAGADLVFAPTVDEIYPPGDVTRVEVQRLSRGLCGASRPGHFLGVTTVVARLLLAAKPHVAVFGMKDYQQLAVIRRMERDLHFGVEIVGVPIVREPDGIAMSSRNTYLSPVERRQARALYAGLCEARARFESGERRAGALIEAVRLRVGKEPLAEIDYIELCATDDLEPVESVEGQALLALAVRFGETRLIDNLILEEG